MTKERNPAKLVKVGRKESQVAPRRNIAQEKLNSIVSRNLRTYRKRFHVKQKDLAHHMGCSPQHLVNFERGQRIDAVRLMLAAEKLGLRIEDFFKEEI